MAVVPAEIDAGREIAALAATKERPKAGAEFAPEAPALIVETPALVDLYPRAPRKTGRASIYTQAIADEITARLADGEPLAEICRDAHMPGVTTVWTWEKDKPELSERIARARQVGADLIASRSRRVAYGEPGYSTGDVQRDRMAVDNDQKLLEKWDPRYRQHTKLDANVSLDLRALVLGAMAAPKDEPPD
jgi:terminase small subunit-like protein